jgi:hypothetical protein
VLTVTDKVLIALTEEEVAEVINELRPFSITSALERRSRVLVKWRILREARCEQDFCLAPQVETCALPPQEAPATTPSTGSPVPYTEPVPAPVPKPPSHPVIPCVAEPDGAGRRAHSLARLASVIGRAVLPTKHERALYWAITVAEHEGALSLRRLVIREHRDACVLPVTFESGGTGPSPEMLAAEPKIEGVLLAAGHPLKNGNWPIELKNDYTSKQAVHDVFQEVLAGNVAAMLRYFSLGATDQFLLYSPIYTAWSKAQLGGTLIPRSEWPQTWTTLADRYYNVDYTAEAAISAAYLKIGADTTPKNVADANAGGSASDDYVAKVTAAYEQYMQGGT